MHFGLEQAMDKRPSWGMLPGACGTAGFIEEGPDVLAGQII